MNNMKEMFHITDETNNEHYNYTFWYLQTGSRFHML